MRPIDADRLMDALYDNEFQTLCPLDEVSGVIDAAPTLDVQPVRRGEWKYESTFVDDVRGPRFVEIARCNLCGGAGANTTFCPNCGADMRGVSE